jgi:hypothetical protein
MLHFVGLTNNFWESILQELPTASCITDQTHLIKLRFDQTSGYAGLLCQCLLASKCSVCNAYEKKELLYDSSAKQAMSLDLQEILVLRNWSHVD